MLSAQLPVRKVCAAALHRAVLVLSAIVVLPATALADDPLARHTAEEIFRLSGVDHAVEVSLESVASGVQQAAGQVPGPAGEKLLAAAARPMDLAPVFDDVVGRLQRGLDSTTADALLEWYRAPLGKRITRIEVEDGEGVDPTQHMQAQIAFVTENPPSEARAQTITELLQSINSEAVLRQVIEATMMSIALGANAAQPKELQAAPAQLREAMLPALDQIMQPMLQIMFAASVAIYAPLEDDELSSYVQFLSTDAGRKFNDVTVDALSAVASAYAFELGRLVGGALDEAGGQHSL